MTIVGSRRRNHQIPGIPPYRPDPGGLCQTGGNRLGINMPSLDHSAAPGQQMLTSLGELLELGLPHREPPVRADFDEPG